ncbi:serine proteinase inhibitor [Clostridium sp. CAG:411]|nr:serpin family protein [Lachnospiraceae bacterium]CDE47553.1 serine proteinase inhibitor [Clostridium sp. CAG:411]
MRKKWLCKVLAGTTIVVSIFGQIPGSPINAAKKLTVSVKSISMKVGDKKLVKTNKNATFTITGKKVVSLTNKKKRQCTVVGKKVGNCTLKIKAGKTVKTIKIKITKKKVVTTPQPTKQPVSTEVPTVAPTQTPEVTSAGAVTDTSAEPTVAPKTMEPSSTPLITNTEVPTVAPIQTVEPTATVAPTQTPQITKQPTAEPTVTPVISATPIVSATPVVTGEPDTILPDTTEVTSEAAKVVNQFGYHLWEKNEDKNMMISPYSIAEAMTMLGNAAEGETKQEILQTMGITDLEQWNKQMQELHKVGTTSDEQQLHIANSVWKNDSTYSFDSEIQKNYIEKLKNCYAAEEKSMDFTNGNPKDQINQWVSKNTNGNIPSILDEDVDSSTYSILANTVYFDAKWWNEYFTSMLTKREQFYGKEKTTNVDMMASDGFQYVKYLKRDGIQMVELDFKGDQFVMDVLLSADEKQTTQEAFQALTVEQKNALFDGISKLETSRVKMTMPKFKSEYSAKHLKGQLQSMGIKKVFAKDSAKLPGIQGNNKENAYVDTVLHKTVIDVKEDGVKASAATVVPIKAGCSPEQPKYIEYSVNRSFVYVIRDKKTNMIYFMGSIEQLDATNLTQ